MRNVDLPDFKEPSKLPPISLTHQQDLLCERLDIFTQKNISERNLSKILKGALFAIREECRSNPDWIAQSAHSFREILYPFYRKDKKTKRVKNNKNVNVVEALKHYGSVTIEEGTIELSKVYGQITEVAHHQIIDVDDYEKLIEDFQKVLFWALARQVDVHKQIDDFFSKNMPEKG